MAPTINLPPSYNNGQNTGSLKNNYRVSSITGNMAGNDANDAWDGGMTVNMSPGTGSSNYTVVCSGKYEVGGYNYTTHQDSIPYTRTLVLLHAFNLSSGSFKLKGFGRGPSSGLKRKLEMYQEKEVTRASEDLKVKDAKIESLETEISALKAKIDAKDRKVDSLKETANILRVEKLIFKERLQVLRGNIIITSAERSTILEELGYIKHKDLDQAGDLT